MTKVLKITELSNKGNIKKSYEMFQSGDYYISFDLKHITKNLYLLGKHKTEIEESNSPRLDAIIENMIKEYEDEETKDKIKEKELRRLGLDKIFANCLYREKNEIEEYAEYGSLYSRQPINMTYYLFTAVHKTGILYHKYENGKFTYNCNKPLNFKDLILVKKNYEESQEFLLDLKESFDIQKMAEKVIENEIITNIEPVYDFGKYQKYDGYKITTNKREILFLICGQDHSQTGVITTDANLKDFIGASFIGYTKVYSREIDDNFEDDKGGNYIAFLNIHTSKGICDLAVHNSNNGYYGAEIRIVDNGVETVEKDFGDYRQWQD